jgi:two-component system phosphate regulon response regulator PhoB
MEFKSLRLQRSTHRVSKGDLELKLGPKEFTLLELFMRYPDKVFSTEELLEKIWGTETDVVAETVRSTIKGLRKKIDDPGAGTSLIATVHGIGYKLESK